MRKDPKEFRERFLRWKAGELVYKDGLPAYEEGKEDEFDSFLKTLPDNQRAPGAYNTRRYWELNGKPKNFAEAIGVGMYNVQEDDGILGWHANSVSHNDKNDTYEFMKPNYHPTRWMELVYGYDKDPVFQKDWKVQYNGPMLSDRYIRREKPGFKIKGGLLPKFADGKESEIYYIDNINPVYLDAKTGDVWQKGKPRGGFMLPEVEVKGKNLKAKETALNTIHEKPLEYSYPEFDVISTIRGITSLLPKRSFKITAKNANNISDEQWDNAYITAIKENDIHEAQRLRDLHFKVKSAGNKAVDEQGNPIKTYHTVGDLYNPEFTEFNPTIEGLHSAIYTSDNPIMSGTYSSLVVSEIEKEYYINSIILNELLNIKNGYTKGGLADLRLAALSNPKSARLWVLRNVPQLNKQINPYKQKQLYVNLKNPVIVDGSGSNWNDIPISNLPKDVYDNIHYQTMDFGFSTRDLERAQKLLDKYDGAIIKNITDYGESWKSARTQLRPSTVYLINNPQNLKLSDAITYDDFGNVIPISKRDNFNIADIRYGLVPFGIGLTGYNYITNTRNEPRNK